MTILAARVQVRCAGKMRQRPRVGRGLLLASCLLPATASAETLNDAIHSALTENPSLIAARARLAVVEEQLPIVRANGLPSLSASANVVQNYQAAAAAFSNPRGVGSVEMTLAVPVYSGGSIRHGMNAARFTIEQGRSLFRGSAATLIANVISTYQQVLQARSIVAINAQYVAELEHSLTATRERFAAGELTRTDIAQTEASLSAARIILVKAQAGADAVGQQFSYFVGHLPGDLAPPGPVVGMPLSAADAVQVALELNPNLYGSQMAYEAARESTKATKGARYPQLQVFATGSHLNYLGTAKTVIPGASAVQASNTGQIGLQIRMPLFQGGGINARIRSAQSQEREAGANLHDTRNDVFARVNSAFSQYSSLQQGLELVKQQVTAAENSFVGVQKLNSLGSRTVQDVLLANQAVLSARIQLIQISTDLYMSQVNLLMEMGSLSEDNISKQAP